MNNKGLTDKIMMIRPSHFGFNSSTALDNKYQNSYKSGILDVDIPKKAVAEFDAFVIALKNIGINVIEFSDAPEQYTPDAVFPNNWISTHIDGSVWLYPMLCSNRRAERRQDIIDYLKYHFNVHHIFNNASLHESQNRFLEGTGSMVLDRVNKIAYASISQRTNKQLFEKWCQKMKFQAISFEAKDGDQPIYHTNVLMSVCASMVFICLDAVTDSVKKEKMLSLFLETGKEVISISKIQMNNFLGNVLELKNNNNKSILVMSSSAFYSLNPQQKESILKKSQIVHSPLPTIEYFGGGSARCMIAELFLEPNM